MKEVYLISTLIEKRANVFRAINNESKENLGSVGLYQEEK